WLVAGFKVTAIYHDGLTPLMSRLVWSYLDQSGSSAAPPANGGSIARPVLSIRVKRGGRSPDTGIVGLGDGHREHAPAERGTNHQHMSAVLPPIREEAWRVIEHLAQLIKRDPMSCALGFVRFVELELVHLDHHRV